MEKARTGRRRPPLTREGILEAALVLVERDGADALTMRALGRELGVEAMSLYNHVPNREAVLEGLGELLMSALPPPDETSWRPACRAFAEHLRAVALEHPQAFGLVGLRPLHSPSALAPVERLLDVLVSAGATPATALVMYRALASFARGYALAEVTGFTVDAGSPARRRPLRALPRDEFPILRGQLEAFRDVDSDAAFDAGLGALLDGFAAGPMADLHSK